MVIEQKAPAAIRQGSRTASRIAWSLCASTLTLIFCAVVLSVLNGYAHSELLFLTAEVAGGLVGGLVASRWPRNPVGWFITGHALLFALGEFSRQYAIYGLLTEPGALPLARAMAWPAYWVWYPGVTLLFSFLPLYFPDGRLVSRRWRPVAGLAVLAIAISTVFAAIQPNDEETPGIPNPLGIESLQALTWLFDVTLLSWLLVGALSAASLVARYRRTGGEERLQIKWFVYAVVLNVFFGIVNQLFGLHELSPTASIVLFTALTMSLWVAITVAILRYRLYDIDLIINRTLVYGALTACVVGIYVLVVGYLGALFRVDDNLAVSLVATGLVAVLFAPLHSRLQRVVNRLMYGERDEPYAAVSRLGERLEAALDPETVPTTIVETVREALRLPYAAITLPRDGAFEVVAASGKPSGGPDPLILPLSYGGETVGRLLLAPRGPGEEFSAADRRLLDDLARHAGVAVHGVRAMSDLRRSREGLVLAREEERRRLRRDLHDELAPTLAALGLTAATVGELIPNDPEEAASANKKLRAAIRTTVGDVRRLVYDLRPPALDELGLVEAIKERSSRNLAGKEGLRVTVEAPKALPPLPAAVEVAAYRIVQEAMTNVSRHSRASTCSVRLACPGSRFLEVEVVDDGVGLSDRPEGGVGLYSMRERAVELGGTCEIGPADGAAPPGTRVFARLPLAGLDGTLDGWG